MNDLNYTTAEVNEALVNIGRLAGRLNADEGKRLFMLMQIVSSHMEKLADENYRLKGVIHE